MLFLLVIGLSLSCLMVGVLHCVDLGVTAHIVGNIFAFCIKNHVFGEGNIAKNTECLHRELTTWSNKNKVSSKLQGQLTWDRIKTKSGWPKLKGKAAATCALADFALDLAKRYCQSDRRIIGVA